MLLVGCSKSSGLSTDGVTVTNGGTEVDVTKHYGYRAVYEDDSMTIDYMLCEEVADCANHSRLVEKADMTKFRDGYYYTLYHESEICLHIPYGDGWIEGYAMLKGENRQAKEVVLENLYNTLSNLVLTDEVDEVSFNNKVFLAEPNLYDFYVKNDSIIIPNMIKISAAPFNSTDTATLCGQSVPHMSSGNYDYYDYQGVTIQVAKGVSVDSLVTVK